MVESWRSGSSWYKKYADGFIEQGGAHYETDILPDKLYPITLHKSFASTSYFKCVACDRQDTFWAKGAMVTYASTTKSGFSFNPCAMSGSGGSVKFSGYEWFACGY